MKIQFFRHFPVVVILIVSVAISTMFISTPVLAESGDKIPKWVRIVVQYWFDGYVSDGEIIYLFHYLLINHVVSYDNEIEIHLKSLRNLPILITHEILELEEISNNPTIIKHLKASNEEFANLPNSKKIIEMHEAKWGIGNPYMNPFTSNILTNDASTILVDFMNEETSDGELFRQISLTNAHGVNIAMTSMFDDYVQSDEAWWMITVSDGEYVSTLDNNIQLNKYGTFIAKKITDENGKFIGIIHAFIDTEHQ